MGDSPSSAAPPAAGAALLSADDLVLALDQGTHASRALVFDRQGTLLAEGTTDVALQRPQPDWVEQDGEELVASLFSAAQAALAQLGPDAARVRVAGLASQRSNAVCWHRQSGAPLSPVFSWQDRREHRYIASLSAHAEAVHRATGLFLSPHYGASKLRWSLRHLPAVRAAQAEGTLVWGPLASFLVCRLLAEHPLKADPQCAARTQLWNLHTGDWDPELLRLFELPAGHLPRCVPTVSAWGTLRLEVPGIGPLAIPLRALNGDQSAAVFGFGWPEADTAYINAGTGAFVQRATPEKPRHATRLLTGVVLEEEPPPNAPRDDCPARLYVLEGTVNGAGSALDWFQREFQMPDLLQRLPGWLAEEPPSLPLFLNGISGLGAPFWQADFASRFEGEGPPEAKAVALLESIVFLLMANVEEMAAYLPPAGRVRVSGGVSRLEGFCQRLADLTGQPVHRRDDPEGTARGIAFLAAGQPARWRGAAQEDVFAPHANAPLRQRYTHWRNLLKNITGI